MDYSTVPSESFWVRGGLFMLCRQVWFAKFAKFYGTLFKAPRTSMEHKFEHDGLSL